MDKVAASFSVVLLIICAVGCGPLETVSGDRSIAYDHDFNTMVKTAEKAIKGSALEIQFAQKSDDEERYTIVFNSNVTVKNESMQQDQGEVIVERISDEQARVIINNPEYHFSVPDSQRKKYDRILKNRIDDTLDE